MLLLTFYRRVVACAMLICLQGVLAQGQHFQHYYYGDSLHQAFTKVILHGSDYYVIGHSEPASGATVQAAITRIDGLGNWIWTVYLNIGSQWNDAVLTPSGHLLVVGNTLPFNANSQSLMGLVTPAGAFSWVRLYNVPGRDWFNRVVLNPVPENGAFPYYVLGGQWDPAGNATWDDVVLLTVSEAGNFGWKKIYAGLFGSTDDEFARDLEALPNGDLILAGNFGTNGVVFRTDNTGAIYNSAGPEGLSFTFADVAQTSGGFLAVGNTFPSVSAFLMRFDSDLLVQWQINLPNLTAVRQVWRDGDDGIYVTGRATVDGLNRGVVLKFQDFGNNPAPLIWMKYLDNEEVAYTGGSSGYLPPNQMAFVDGRNTTEERAFMSVSDLEMNTCMTREGFVSTLSADLLFNSPVPPGIEFADVPMGANVTLSSAVNWQQEDACPAILKIVGTVYRECNDLPYTDQAVLPGWTVQLLDTTGNLLAEQQTDSVGGYGFYNLPQGLYTCRIVLQPGWTPNVPLSGRYLVDGRNTSELRNFGVCPSCSCDDIYFEVVQIPGASDTCEFGLTVNNTGAYCFSAMNLALSAGRFEEVMPANGWEVVAIDSQHVQLTAIDPDWTGFVFHRWKSSQASMSEVTVSTSYNVGQGNVVCSRVFGLVCPPPVIARSCCPSGTTPGPELVQNGDFELGNQGFTNSYIYLSPGNSMPSGRYSVLDAGEVYTANNQWACTDHTASLSTGKMLVVDGYGGPIAWQQTVNVTAGVKYTFSAWFNNLVRPPKDYADPQVALWVDNTQIAGPLTLPETPDRWVLLCDTFYATATGTVTLSIRMLAGSTLGNDLAVDDVSFQRCVKCEPLPDDAIAWWPMDEVGGEANADEIVGGLTAVSLPGSVGFGGPNPVPGKVGGALEFVSPGGRYLEVSNHPKINFGNGAFTIDAWVNTNMPTQTAPIVDKLANQSNGYAFAITGTPGLAYPTLAIGASSGVEVFQGPPIAVGKWNFVAVTVNPPVVTFYVGSDPGGNGILATSTHTLIGVPNASNNFPLQIGRNPLNPHWQIVIDELELFERALAPTELDKIWAADRLGKCRKVCPPQCSVNTIDISTGADPLNAGTFLAPGGTDPSWMLVAAPPNAGLPNLPQPANLVGAHSGWAAPPSTWISAFPFNNYGTNNCAAGPQNCSCPPFVYERRFCVCKRTEATFKFDFYTDNNGRVELWMEDPNNPSLPVFVASLADNCANLNAVMNFTTPLAVNTTLTLLPGRYMLRINNWNISSVATGANLYGTVTGLDLESDLCCIEPVGSLCVTKYHDLDCDSIRDINTANWTYIDPGLPNWTFQVAGLASSYTGMTNQQGQVCFTGLAPGTYTVTETLQQGWIPSSPGGGSTTVTVNAYSTTNVDFGNCTDSCACGPYEFLCSIGKGLLLSKNCGDVLFVPSDLPFQFLPSFSCKGDCTNPPTVDYVLTGPPGFTTQSANGVPIATLPITAATFTLPGTYHLTIIGHCDGKLCPCELTFIFPGDCCKDYQFFLANIQSFVSVTADNVNCKATLNIGNLPACDYLEWIDWGDGSPQQYGPFKAGDMVMHTYAGSGAYSICYLAVEKDPATGLICFEKVVCDTIFLSCSDSWCPYNYVQNGDFEVGTPTPGDQDICNALRWCGIWSGGSTADFYSTSPPTLPPGAAPVPVGQGKFGGMWCRKQGSQRVWREGMMNELQQTILPNSGCYELTFKIACTGFYFGTPILNAYGVHAPGGLASGISPIDGSLPPNLGLFPAGAAVQLGSHPIPSTCDNNFLNPAQLITFNINSALLPATGITHIFFTRDDNTNGGVYIALDDVCFRKVPCPSEECCKDYQAFSNRIDSAISVTAVSGSYQLAISNTLLPCDYIEWIDWGDGSPPQPVPFPPGGSILTHTYSASGPYAIIYLAVEKDPATGLICFEKVGTLGLVDVEELWQSRAIRLYPNPNTGHFTLELPAPAPSGTTIRITDPTGRLAFETIAKVGSERQQVQAGALPAGLYFAQVLQEGRVVGILRFVKP